MPRKTIEPELKTESLSILREDGSFDQDLVPDLSNDECLKLYRTMLLTRHFDDRMLKMQRQGRLGTFPPVSGQEAAHVGSEHAILASDWMVPSFREVGAMLSRGWSMESILLFYAGFEKGSVPPPGVLDLPICVPVTSQLPHAVGISWASQLKGEDQVTLCYFGDGATSEGDFHESLNFASVYQLPLVFFCQNNQWAISLPLQKQTRSKTLAQKALAFEIPGIQVDGNDVLATYAATREAVERARAGGGPTMIEARTYRMSVHTTADDPTRYRTDQEVAEWAKKDPLTRFSKYLQSQGILDSAGQERLLGEVLEEIRGAVENAESQMSADPLEIFDYTYEKMTPELTEQRKELERHLSVRADTVGTH